MINNCQVVRHVSNRFLGVVVVELFNDLGKSRRGRLIFSKGVDNEAVIDDLLALEGKPVGREVLLSTGNVLIRPDQVFATVLMGIDFDLPPSSHVGYFLPARKLGVMDGKVDDCGIGQRFVMSQFRDGQGTYFRFGGRCWLGGVGGSG